MFGWSMPTPLAMPVTTTRRPSISATREAAFGTVSVVMIAAAASAQFAARSVARHSGSAASMRSTGSGSRMTPVENGSTSSGRQPSARATASQVRSAARTPASPVPQFAFPALVTSARIGRPAARRRRQIWTGAAAKLFRVNTPATRVPGANRMSIRSRPPRLRMPAAAKPSSTPSTAASFAGSGGFRLTAIPVERRAQPPAAVGVVTTDPRVPAAAARLGQAPVAMLELLARSARARIVAAHLAHLSDEGRGLAQGRDLTFGLGLRAGADERLLHRRMLVLHVRRGMRLGLEPLDLADLLRRLQIEVGEDARRLQLDRLEHRAEQLERLALVLLLRILLRVPAQVDPLAQMIECGEVLAPVLVEDLEQDVALGVRDRLRRDLRHARRIGRIRGLEDPLEQRLLAEVRLLLEPLPRRDVQADGDVQVGFESRDVPLFLDALGRDVRAEDVGHDAVAQALHHLRQALILEDAVAQLVDVLALVVGDGVVLEELLADVEVVRLDLPLRALDRAGDQGVLDRLALGHLEPFHDRLDALAGEDPQQLVVEPEVEARGAGIALPAGAAAQLVVDAPRLVALGADDVQAAGVDHLLVEHAPFGTQRRDALGLRRLVHVRIGLDDVDLLLHVAAEDDVGAAAGHVGRDRDHLRPSGLRDDLRLVGVLFRVEDLVGEALLLQHRGELLGVLDRRRAHQHRL